MPPFIVFEGLDGSGASTQLQRLSDRLYKKHIPFLTTYEPTDHAIGKLIRSYLLKEKTISPAGLQLLFCADRADHLVNDIYPALKAGKVVISNRYMWSTIAFGSLSLPEDWLQTLNEHFPEPDLTLYLKAKPETCTKRIHTRGKKKELFEELKKLMCIEKTFKKLVQKSKKVVIIDAEQSVDSMEDAIWGAVKKLLKIS